MLSHLNQQMPPKPATHSQPSGRAASRQSQNPNGSQANANVDGIHEDEVSQTRNHNEGDDLPPPPVIDLASHGNSDSPSRDLGSRHEPPQEQPWSGSPRQDD